MCTLYSQLGNKARLLLIIKLFPAYSLASRTDRHDVTKTHGPFRKKKEKKSKCVVVFVKDEVLFRCFMHLRSWNTRRLGVATANETEAVMLR